MTSISPDSSEKSAFVGETLKVFISHSHKDNKIASAIKNAFNYYGINAFLAKEDIQVGQKWPNEILYNLKKCTIFVAIISENFKQSFWTNQEVGFAFCQEKIIVPISIDDSLPYGLIYDCQSLTSFKCKEQMKHSYPNEEIIDCKESVFEIIEIIASKIEFKNDIKRILIDKLCKLRSYDDAEKYFELLNKLQPFSKGQINDIIDKSMRNNQIHKAQKCQKILRELIENYKSEIDDENKLVLSKLI